MYLLKVGSYNASMQKDFFLSRTRISNFFVITTEHDVPLSVQLIDSTILLKVVYLTEYSVDCFMGHSIQLWNLLISCGPKTFMTHINYERHGTVIRKKCVSWRVALHEGIQHKLCLHLYFDVSWTCSDEVPLITCTWEAIFDSCSLILGRLNKYRNNISRVRQKNFWHCAQIKIFQVAPQWGIVLIKINCCCS